MAIFPLNARGMNGCGLLSDTAASQGAMMSLLVAVVLGALAACAAGQGGLRFASNHCSLNYSIIIFSEVCFHFINWRNYVLTIYPLIHMSSGGTTKPGYCLCDHRPAFSFIKFLQRGSHQQRTFIFYCTIFKTACWMKLTE